MMMIMIVIVKLAITSIQGYELLLKKFTMRCWWEKTLWLSSVVTKCQRSIFLMLCLWSAEFMSSSVLY